MFPNKKDLKESNKDLVSVVIASYNYADYIEECLNSIISDGYEPKEIVLIDDGSTDNSQEVIKNWMSLNRVWLEQHRFYCEFKENEGIVRTLNKLIDNSYGEFICIVASDDYVLNGGIEDRVNYLKCNPSKMAVFADSIVVDKQGKQIFESSLFNLFSMNKQSLLSERLLLYDLVINWGIAGPVFMARRSCYEKFGKYDENFGVEDLQYYLILAKNNVLGFLDSKVAAYRVHGKNVSLSHESRPMIVAANKEIALKFFSEFKGIIKLYLFAYMLMMISHEKKQSKNYVFSFIYHLLSWLIRKYVRFCYYILRNIY